MNKIEQIKAEIERLYESYKNSFHEHGDDYYLGLYDGLDMAKRVVNSLPEEPSENIGHSEDLEKEIERFLASEESTTYKNEGSYMVSFKDPKKIARHFAKWQKEQMEKQAREYLAKTDLTLADLVAFDEGFALGRRLERQDMMKDAVEGKVYMSFAPGHNQMVMADVDLPVNTKVKLIIVKED